VGTQYITTNVYLAAALLSHDIKLVDVDRLDSRHIKFIFEGDGVDAVVIDWDNKELEVNAREYADALREIKLKIHQL
jgi:hypothetical protein